MFVRQFVFGSKHNQLLMNARIWVVLSVSMGLALLILLSSIFNGFEHDLRMQFYKDKPHIFVFHSKHTTTESLMKNLNIIHVERRVSVPIMLTHKGLSQFIILSEKTEVEKGEISIPHNFASLIAARDGDKVQASALNKTTLLPYPIHSDYVVDVKQNLITPIAYVRSLEAFSSIKSLHSGWWVRVDDLTKKNAVIADLSEQGLEIYDMDTHLQFLLATLNVQKSLMTFVFTFVVIMLFTQLISMLRQITNGFIPHVAYLKVSGVSRSRNKSFLMKLNLSIIIFTMILGLILGLFVSHWATDLCAALEHLLGWNFMKKTAFMLDYLPSRISFFEVAVICLVFVCISVCLIYRIASRAVDYSAIDVFRGNVRA